MEKMLLAQVEYKPSFGAGKPVSSGICSQDYRENPTAIGKRERKGYEVTNIKS